MTVTSAGGVASRLFGWTIGTVGRYRIPWATLGAGQGLFEHLVIVLEPGFAVVERASEAPLFVKIQERYRHFDYCEPGPRGLDPQLERHRVPRIRNLQPRQGAGAVVDAQFAVEVVDVPFDRSHGQEELLGDLGIAQASRDQAEHFVLALAQRLDDVGIGSRGSYAGAGARGRRAFRGRR